MRNPYSEKNLVHYFFSSILCFMLAFFCTFPVLLGAQEYEEDEDYYYEEEEEKEESKTRNPATSKKRASLPKKAKRLGEKTSSSSSSSDELTVWLNQIEELKKQNNNKIILLVSKVLNKDPGNSQALLALGTFYLNNNKERLAKIVFNLVLEKKLHLDKVYNNLGVASLKQGNLGEAIEMFTKSLDEKSNKIAPAANLGSIYLGAYNYALASKFLEIAWKNRSHTSLKLLQNIGNNYALALSYMGKEKRAKEVFEEVIDSDVKDPRLFINYAIMRIKISEDKDKSKIMDLLNRADFLDKTGQYDNKIRTLRDGVENLFP